MLKLTNRLKEVAIASFLMFIIFLLSGGIAFVACVVTGGHAPVDNPKMVSVSGLVFLNIFMGFTGILIIAKGTDPTPKIQRMQTVGWILVFAHTIVMQLLWNFSAS